MAAAADKVRVVHPEFASVSRNVPADEVEQWVDAGWLKEKTASRSSSSTRKSPAKAPARKSTARKSSSGSSSS